ncbi:DUF1905 domain-containing protein [Aeromicrobium sp. YIM 150415]|uniref:DUF1905 domain-containing protein n=1 Tax=Aeromicrobium sp. YIM 150415 TaxID=2803912 RepID=UPI001964358F|nr:DUF1905 domain-containing protein [Aeromicrobium sp. YIM 150415]MBM9463628.1 DUF1905 domain-containing protein [Aeromicrobium sp. YIM 150415]
MPYFRTEFWSADGRNTGIEVPEEVVTAFGRGKRVPVVVTTNEKVLAALRHSA